MVDLLGEGAGPFALLRRADDPEVVLLLRGEVTDLEHLADLPAPGEHPVLAMVPYRQVAERGFAAHDDGAPLRVLLPRHTDRLPVAEVAAALTELVPEPAAVSGERMSVSDADYAAMVRRVITDEIGHGEGANFVLRRDVVADVEGPPSTAALGWFARLLEAEAGAHWTFVVHTPGHTLVGASPERHVGVAGGRAVMNPISGTFRHGEHATPEALVEAFRGFLSDTKETEELFMVVDEEMKMMARVCASGGRMTGPHLKQMAHLTHTEYLLDGATDMDPREVLRETMFAPTVTGSPMENACRVIHRHEPTGRGYYSGVLALLDRDEEGRERLDAPIVIRTAQLPHDGTVSVSAGATLVRHSDPEAEVAETAVKATGMLAAMGLRPQRPVAEAPDLAALPEVSDALAARNERLSPFWLAPQAPTHLEGVAGASVLVVDAEDAWTQMLAHQLRHLGLRAEVRRWDTVTPEDVAGPGAPDLLLSGPGPGDPSDLASSRIARLHELVRARLGAGLPLVAVCLSHQVLSHAAGLPIVRLEEPQQGVQLEVDWFGRPARIGFYNTFVARHGGEPVEVSGRPLEVTADPTTGAVRGLRGPGVASIQGHAESVLSADGLPVLQEMVRHALGGLNGSDTDARRGTPRGAPPRVRRAGAGVLRDGWRGAAAPCARGTTARRRRAARPRPC
ncbi:phenazine-specific anthranilate synthase component I [Kytococcus schroeteri]|uniref:anthranilate synthase n=1 Tax=Kytococcus schroeteri TaxID=138300 RepID=A0A2I1P8I0_9MICO|nr:phenazine-specific anthranilate synthase component I [Kytococcus schroeteri]